MLRILITDPDSAARRALALFLRRKLGMSGSFEIADVEALVRALAESPPDVLLLDWRLHGFPALETCRLIQKVYPRLSMVLLSVDAGGGAAARAAGAHFFHKGAPPDELIATLEPVLRKDT